MAEIANIFAGERYLRWVNTPAEPSDLDKDLESVVRLADVMRYHLKAHAWAAVSSNNVFTPELGKPRIVQIPRDCLVVEDIGPIVYLDRVTIANPEIVEISKEYEITTERCGSLDVEAVVKRPKEILIDGLIVEETGGISRQTVRLANTEISAPAHHEMRHLDGFTILDDGYVADLRPLQGIHYKIGYPFELSTLIEEAIVREIKDSGNEEKKRNACKSRKNLIASFPLTTLELVLKYDKKAPALYLHAPSCKAFKKRGRSTVLHIPYTEEIFSRIYFGWEEYRRTVPEELIFRIPINKDCGCIN